MQRRRVDGEVGRAVAVRDALHDARPRRRASTARWSRRCSPSPSRTLDGGVLRAGLDEDLGRRAPDDRRGGRSLLLGLEVADVLAQLLGEVALGLALLDVGAVDARDVVIVEHRRHRLDGREEIRDAARDAASSSTPAFFAAVYASSGIGSQAPKTRSSSPASGTKSLISGDRLSVRLPRRIVAICVSDPIGLEWPRRMLSTPAMNVVATAPRPGVRMPSLPVAGRGGVRDRMTNPARRYSPLSKGRASYDGVRRGADGCPVPRRDGASAGVVAR